LSRCRRNTPHGSICYNGLCGTTQQSMPSLFIKMLDVESIILAVDDIEYQHRLMSCPRQSVTQHTTSVQPIEAHRHLKSSTWQISKNLASRQSWYMPVISHSQLTTTLSSPRFLKVETPGEIRSSSPTNDSDTLIETNRYSTLLDSTSFEGVRRPLGRGRK
jgi:hypothetical protein